MSRLFMATTCLICLMLVPGKALGTQPRVKTTFRYKFKAGEKLHYVLEHTLTSPGKSRRAMQSVMATKTYMTWHITEVDKKGIAAIKVRIERVHVSALVPGSGTFEFDSKTGKVRDTFFLPFFRQAVPGNKGLVGSHFTIKMNSRGQHSDVKIPEQTKTKARKARGADFRVRGIWNEIDALHHMDPIGFVLPEQAIAAGESWQRSEKSNIGKIDWAYTYQGPKKGKGKGLEQINIKKKIKFSKEVKESPEGGFMARALGKSIFTQYASGVDDRIAPKSPRGCGVSF